MKEISLNGEWTGRINYGLRGPRNPSLAANPGDRRAIPFRVPGEVHLDLMRAGLLDDVYVGGNVLKARWAEECEYYYTKTFELDFEPGERVLLTLEKLDLTAAVYLNGKFCGNHHNFFRPCILDVTDSAVLGKNVLCVVLSSGLLEVSEKPIARYHFMPDQFDHFLHKRNWLRKPQFEFGWDWCERLVNVGIQGNVKVEIGRAFVTQISLLTDLSPDSKTGTLRVRAFVRGEGELTLRTECAGRTAVVRGDAGAGVLEAELTVDNPELWQPRGFGKPSRYPVKISVCLGGKTLAEQERFAGFRRARVLQEPTDAGESFVLEINGNKIFARGANMVPADMILANLSFERYEKLVAEALSLNMNFLRVWGGGIYESDEFYELCDREGILVWQEFIFACINYPDDPEFSENFMCEAEYQVRRLSCHPSLVVWCGNNEIESFRWNYPNMPSNREADELYFQKIPDLLEREDNRFYWPSSPFSGEERDPHDERRGDQHPWEIGFDRVDYRRYRELECTFADEGGLNGAVSLETAREIFMGAEPEIHAPEFVLHDNFIDLIEVKGVSACNNIVFENIGIDPTKIPYGDFVYLSGLVQGEALREYIFNFRTRKFDSGAAVYWMFNDCWPTVRSWPVFDYYFRRGAGYDAVRSAFEPATAAFRAEGTDRVLYAVNDTGESAVLCLEYGICNVTDGVISRRKSEAEIPANGRLEIDRIPAPDSGSDFAYVLVRIGGRIAGLNRYFEVRLKELDLADPEISEIYRDGKRLLTAKRYAVGVRLDTRMDFVFDLLPGVEREVPEGAKLLGCLNDYFVRKR